MQFTLFFSSDFSSTYWLIRIEKLDCLCFQISGQCNKLNRHSLWACNAERVFLEAYFKSYQILTSKDFQKNRWLFSQKTPSKIFEKVLNTLLFVDNLLTWQGSLPLNCLKDVFVYRNSFITWVTSNMHYSFIVSIYWSLCRT